MPKPIEEIPFAPGGETFLGHNREFRLERLPMLDRFAQTTQPLLRLRIPIPGVHALVVNSPDTVHELLALRAKSFDKSDMMRFTLHHIGGEGLFTSNGDLWRRQRKLMAPLFQPRSVESYADAMVAASERVVSRWTDGAAMRLLRETTALTMSIAGKTLFDADTFGEADEIGRALTVALEWTAWSAGRPISVSHLVARRALRRLAPRAPSWAGPALSVAIDRLQRPLVLVGERGRSLQASVALLDARVQRMIDDRRAALARGERREDLLTKLLEARDEDDAGSATATSAMSDRQIRDEILTLFIAGHETTATGLAWTVYLLCKNPAIYEAVQREVDALPAAPCAADLGRLDLCARVFKEALRLYPPVYIIGRDANELTTLAGFEIPPLTQVAYSAWSVQRSPHVWPDPLRFDPDRFLPENEAKRHRYAWIPFGAGPRVCIGNHFAIMEAQLALAVILRHARFELDGEEELEPSATLRPRHGVRVRVRLRGRAAISSGVAASATSG
jgi:cytochrome P450